jgi:adenylyltransferase/sulfurtransferase
LALFDGMAFQWREVRINRNPECPVCGDAPTQTGLIDYEEFCGLGKEEVSGMDETDGVPEMTAIELKARLERGETITLLDVREPREWPIGNLGEYGATLVPLGQIPDRLGDLEFAGEVVVYCRSGARSAQAAAQLRAGGIERVWNLAGGLLAWSADVDPDMPRY